MGRPPFTYAVAGGHETIVWSLVDHRANPHRAVDFCGRKLISLRQIDQPILAMVQEAEESRSGSASADGQLS